MKDNDFKNLADQIGALKSLMASQIPTLDKQVEDIIANKVRDQQTIERLLDMLLDYCHMGEGASTFKKLNKYYATIQPDNAKSYEQFYNDI